ncbi:glycosyl hydrolase family 28-related protein, partial [Streptomyces caeruleatus]
NWLNTINDHVFEYNFNVKDFGAVGDGVADDTAAIQAAITAAQGQPIYVPKGTYVITSTLTQTAPVTWGVFSPGLKIYGAGVGVTFFDNRVTTGPMIDIDSLT